MRAAWRLSLLGVICGLLLDCSGPQSVAGGGSDLPDLRVTVCRADGSPAGDQPVQLKRLVVASDGARDTAVYTGRSDAAGRLSFADLTPGAYVLCSRDSAAGLLAVQSALAIAGDDSTVSAALTLRSAVTLIGRVQTDAAHVGAIRAFIPGVATTVAVNADSTYAITGAPQGDYLLCLADTQAVNYLPVSVTRLASDTLFVRDVRFADSPELADRDYRPFESALAASLAIVPTSYALNAAPPWYADKDFEAIRYYRIVNDTERGEILLADSVSLLVDDFDDGDAYSRLWPQPGASRWYPLFDTGLGGNSIIEPLSIQTDPATALTSSGAFRLQSLHATISLGGAIDTPFAWVGLHLAPGDSGSVDLRRLRSLRCTVRGSGSLMISLISSRHDPSSSTPGWPHPTARVTLPAEWQQVVIDSSQFTVAADSAGGLSFGSLADSVRAIAFGVRGQQGTVIDCWLDEIYLDGVTTADLLH